MRNLYLLFASAAFICGELVLVSGIFGFIPPFFLLVILAAFFFLPILFFKKNILFIILLFCLIFLLGATRYAIFNMIDKDNIKNYIYASENPVLLQGTVTSDIDTSPAGKKTTFTLEAFSIKEKNGWKRAKGFVLVNVYGGETVDLKYADIVLLEGALKAPYSYYTGKSNFNYRKYLGNKRIYAILSLKKGFFAKKIAENKSLPARIKRNIYSLRAKLRAHIEKYLESPADSLLRAMLLGKRQGIARGLKGIFAKTGTLHILAISGLHVGIIYFVLRVILKIFRVRKNISVILSVLVLTGFAILAGGRPSTIRAATMFSIFALGGLLGRKIGTFNLIGLSSLILLLVNPNQVFDTGFILSYAAILSIVGISPFFYRIFSVENTLKLAYTPGGKIKCYLLRSVSVSLAVWVGLFPLIAYYFGLISPVVVVANLVVVPLLFGIMGSGLLFISLGFLSGFLARIFSQAAWFFIVILVNSAKFFKDIPFSHFRVNPPAASGVILYYLALIVAMTAR